MSLLAKIFIVVNAILSLLFLGVQSTLFYHSNNWQEAYERLTVKNRAVVAELNDKIKVEQQKSADLTNTITTREGEMNVARTATKNAEDRLQDALNALNDAKSKYQGLDTKYNVLASSINAKDQAIGELNARVKELGDQRADALSKEELAEAQVARLSTIKTTLEKDLAEARKDYTKTKQELLDDGLVLDELRRIGIPVDTIVINHKPVPPINGTVAGVDTKAQPELVLINVGKDDKVERGYTFTVYRQSKFVGKIIVEKIMADSAGCRVMLKATGENIQPGDSVATRLD
jgi:hypothetical protein